MKSRNRIDNAWIYIGQGPRLKSDILEHDALNLHPLIVCKKFSNLEFEMMSDENGNGLAIGGLGRFSSKTENNFVLDAVYSPQTLKKEVDDVWRLQCKTPLELFMKLELLGLVLFQ